MIGYMYIVLRQYPKSEKFVLAAETKRAALELMELIISCNKHYMKKTTMRDMDIQLDTLRAMVRLGHTLGFLKNHPYEVLSGKIDEIGRMIGGWMKSIQA
ncbi:MAG: diversity-generating retroelement protein Avd [Selenomonas ruminantium]|nr:diversity-generating retroelement protein Avd [Selenomonas ruminantium]